MRKSNAFKISMLSQYGANLVSLRRQYGARLVNTALKNQGKPNPNFKAGWAARKNAECASLNSYLFT